MRSSWQNVIPEFKVIITAVSCDVDFSATPLAEFGDLINHYATENNLDPWIIAAIIMVESGGDPNAYNEVSMATGLGQIIPYEYGFEDRPTIEELKDPETNIKWICIILADIYNPEHGYALDFVSRVMTPLLKKISDKKIKVISNAGGVNPLACRDALQKVLEAQGLDLKIAVVLGDDLMPQ